MSVNVNDFVVGFDPTGSTEITAEQLAQLVNSAYPQVDKGMSILTTDVGSNPVVPNAATTTKWKRYLWIRQSTSSVGLYVWNENAASDVTYLKWVSANVAGIGAGSIINTMIADNTIQDAKISNLSYSKLIGAPTGFPPSGAAGSGGLGDLTGTYPNPTIADNAIGTSKISALAVTNAKIETAVSAITGIDFAKLRSNGVAKDMLRSKADYTQEWFTPPKLFTSATAVPSVTGSDDGKLLSVLSGAGGTFQYITNNQKLIQTVVQRLTGHAKIAPGTSGVTGQILKSAIPQMSISSGVLTAVGTAANYRTGSQFGLGVVVTPVSASSNLIVEGTIFLTTDASDILTIALYDVPLSNYSANTNGVFTFLGNLVATNPVIDAVAGYGVVGQYCQSGIAQCLRFKYIYSGYAAGTALHLLPLIGTNGSGASIYLNSQSNADADAYGAAILQSSITVQEILL